MSGAFRMHERNEGTPVWRPRPGALLTGSALSLVFWVLVCWLVSR